MRRGIDIHAHTYTTRRGEQARTHMQQLTSNATRRKLSTTALWESTGSSVALPPEEQAKAGKASSERRPLLFKRLVPWPLGPKCSHYTYLLYLLNACWTSKVSRELQIQYIHRSRAKLPVVLVSKVDHRLLSYDWFHLLLTTKSDLVYPCSQSMLQIQKQLPRSKSKIFRSTCSLREG
jgi:hypothetical protein